MILPAPAAVDYLYTAFDDGDVEARLAKDSERYSILYPSIERVNNNNSLF